MSVRQPDTEVMPPDVQARFESLIILPDDDDACWGWAGKTNGGHGYPVFVWSRHNRTHTVAVPRACFELFKRPLLPGEKLIRAGHPYSCINPEHVAVRRDKFSPVSVVRAKQTTTELVVIDPEVRQRRAPRTSFDPDICVNGHSRAEYGVTYRDGHLRCKKCMSDAIMAYRRRKALGISIAPQHRRVTPQPHINGRWAPTDTPPRPRMVKRTTPKPPKPEKIPWQERAIAYLTS